MKRLLRAVILVHRWTGVFFCSLFLVWFASGLVMIWHRMPEYTAAERLARLAPVDPDDVAVHPSMALSAAGLAEYPQRAQLTTFGSRPVYRFLTARGWRSVFADDGTILEAVSPQDAVGVAEDAFPAQRGSARLSETITAPDQWTIGSPFGLTGALHKVALGDPEQTEVYVASLTGEITMKTDGRTRLWGYLGPVLHWFYFRPLRVQGAVWSPLIVYGSLAGAFVCIAGLVIGVARLSPRRRYQAGTSFSPYGGWLRWHHYTGLTFGAIAFMFVFSGMLSMQPWNWSPGNGPDPAQVLAIRGGRINVDRFALSPADALREMRREFQPAEIELRQFLGAPYYIGYRPPAAGAVFASAGYTATPVLPHLLVSAIGGEPQVGEQFNAEELLEAARAAMPDAAPLEAHWMTEFDAYYYGRTANERRLPVLRVKFNDAEQTWLYLDAHDGSLVQREVTRSRVERWVYHGLHSLDFPGLYQRPTAWYGLITALSLGGVALSLTSMVIGWRAIRRRVSWRPSTGTRSTHGL